MSFTTYLEQSACFYSPSTVKRYTRFITRFLNWLEAAAISAATFTYNDLLDFMRYCYESGASKKTVHDLLCVIRHYCAYLISEGNRDDNPAAGVFIKGLARKLPVNIVSMEMLEELYRQYSIQLQVDSSKKIMLGLLIYQGLTAGELTRIEAAHIQLREGKIFIKGTKRSNERVLSLQAVQMIELQNYVAKNKFREGSFFIEAGKRKVSEHNIINRMHHMFGQLKQLNKKITNAKQIRNSVITHWLRTNDLRQVQYMVGHKYVSSTERYQFNNLEDLARAIAQHHPLR